MNINNIFDKENKLIVDNFKWYIYQKYLKQKGISNNRAVELTKYTIDKLFRDE